MREELEFLVSTDQARKTRAGFRAARPLTTVDTGGQAERALKLELTGARLALERLSAGAPGHVGYSLFAVSRQDMKRIRQVQLEEVRALSGIIARSESSECVGLYAAQLNDLASADNVFAGDELPRSAP